MEDKHYRHEGIGNPSSRQTAQAAIMMAISDNRDEEKLLKQKYAAAGMRVAAMDFGGEAVTAVSKIIERAVVGAKREGVISDCHADEGAVAGATHEILSQVMSRSIGLNFGGKIGVARQGDHLCVAVFFAIGMLHLDDVAIGISHRALSTGSKGHAL
ncbi:MAG: HutP family protein [Firmicutes bacterium]|nr:HutP family protein [Bacillota bacterium]